MSQDPIAQRSLVRYVAFLRHELEVLPAGHPLVDEYTAQLRELEGHLRPRGVAS